MTEPVKPEARLVPVGYADLLDLVTSEVTAARVQAARVVNTELVVLYWRIGTLIRQRRAEQGWSTKVVDRLAADLRAAFPGMRGFSPRNLVYMRTFAGAVEGQVAQQAVAQLPWGHITVLLDKLHNTGEREFYATRAARYGWSRAVLTHHITTGLHLRAGEAVTLTPMVRVGSRWWSPPTW